MACKMVLFRNQTNPVCFYKRQTAYTSGAERVADQGDVTVNINCKCRTGAVLVSQHAVVTREGPANNTYVTVAGTAIACC